MNVDVLTILYGSQTGNAEDLAKRIGLKAKRKGLKVLVEAFDDFNIKLLPKQNVIIFVCSTTGHGQEPENMKRFYNFIRRRDLPNQCLSNLKFVVYGLGDSSYAKFNYVSKILFKRLKELGAKPLQELIAGDEQHSLGCDGIIYPKLDQLWSQLAIDIDQSTSLFSDLPESSYDIRFIEDDSNKLDPNFVFSSNFIRRYEIKDATCTINERVTPDSHFQDTRFLSFKSTSEIDYEPGDVCSILPSNSDDDVDTFLEALGLDPNQKFAITKRDPSYMVNYLYDFIPGGLSIHQLVKYYLDIQSVPRRSFFEYLWPFSNDDIERGKLQEFSTTEGQSDMYEYCIQPKRSILEVLIDFPKTRQQIKFEYLLDLIPPIKPRSFSIASSLSKHPGEFQLIVGVVNYRTRLRKIRRGLCSNYLASFKEDHHEENILKFSIKKTSFKLPNDESIPIVMIGPGLGIAPMRSFIEHRSTGNNFLYFGCRFDNVDFYFKDELKEYEEDGRIKLRVAFSRQNFKQYVQDLLVEDSDMIKALIEQSNAILYVAGNSKLPEDIRKVLQKILSTEEPDCDSQPNLSRVLRLESESRIQYDCW